jgi:lysophospholipase L1-like esterase
VKLSIPVLILVTLLPGALRANDKRTTTRLIEKDRVLLLGGGFIEQERLHCYLETRLLRHHPRGGLLIRNLGWGGDTVRGSARTGGFENPEGFARLFREVAQWQPTVIFIGYGMNESFAGAAGLDAFVKDYGSLLDKLAPLKARMILLSPTYHEPLGPLYPDATAHNEHLKAYSETIHALAQKRGLEFIDLFDAVKKAKDADPDRVFTTNGIQPNAAGYALIARTVEGALGYPVANGWRISVSAEGVVKESIGAKATGETTKRGLRLSIHEKTLAVADPLGKDELFLKVTGLPDEMHLLEIGQEEVARATAATWARGLSIPVWKHAGEELRQAIIVKNDLFYRRWRPFNDHSRHFDFLKGDFSLYDKAIAERERAIATMLTPRLYSVEIVPLGKQ